MIHAYRIVTSPERDTENPWAEREERVAANHRLVLPEQGRRMTLLPAEDGEPERFAGLYRTADGAAAVKETIRAELADRAWAVVYVHDCRHDETPVRPCGQWTVALIQGDVPEAFVRGLG